MKYGGAESFQHVTVEFIPHQHATLTIYDYHTNAELEQVDLQAISTEQEMVDMMLSKGFVYKSQTEIDQLKEQRRIQKEREDERRQQSQERSKQRLLEYQNKLKNGEDEKDGTGGSDETKSIPIHRVADADQEDIFDDDGLTPQQRIEQQKEWKRQKWNEWKRQKDKSGEHDHDDVGGEQKDEL